jgi:predicted MFS family arabinose efflux permease
VAVAGGIGVFLVSLIAYTFGIFLQPIAEEFSWSREAVSSAYAFTAIAMAVTAVPVGYLIDRYGARPIIVPCVTLTGCAFASLSALTPNLWHLYAIFALLGIAGSGMSAVAYSRVVSSWFDQRRGIALAVVVCGGSIGALVHPPAAEAMTRFVGWRGATFAFGGLFLLVGLPAAIALVRERPVVTGIASTRLRAASLVEGLTARGFWLQMIVLFCSSIAQNAALVHLAPLLTDRGVSGGDAALAMSAMGGAGLAGRLLTGWLLDRYFAPYVSFVLLAVAALGTFLLSGSQSFAMGALAGMCIGFGMGGESDVTPYLFSRYFGLRSLSTLYGFTWIATGLAAAIGPILMGRAFDATGSYETLLIRLSILTLAVAGLMFVMPRYAPFDSERNPPADRPTGTDEAIAATVADGPPGFRRP